MRNLLLLFIVSITVLSCSKVRDHTCQEANEYVLSQMKGKLWDVQYRPNGDTATFPPVFSSQGPNKLYLYENGRVYEPFYFQPDPSIVLADTGTYSVTDCGHSLFLRTNLSGPEGLKFEIKSYSPTSITISSKIVLVPGQPASDVDVIMSNPRVIE